MNLFSNLTPIEHITQVLFMTLVASILGASSYGICRWMENRWSNFPWFAAFLGPVLYAVCVLVGYANRGIIVIFIITLPVALAGGAFHRMAMGRSANFPSAVCLSFSSIMLTFVVNALLTRIPTQNFIVSVNSVYALIAYVAGVILYPALTPLVLALWQRSRPRPGIEVHVADGSVSKAE